jgi:hypothetical protein
MIVKYVQLLESRQLADCSSADSTKIAGSYCRRTQSQYNHTHFYRSKGGPALKIGANSLAVAATGADV